MLAAILTAVALTACHRGSSDQTAYMRSMSLPTPFVSESASSLPSFSAETYRTGHRTLTASQVALIRKTLVFVKPCQRDFLRYAFPKDPDYPFVIFFQQSTPFEATPVLWTHNMYYDPHDGRVFATSDGYSPNNTQFEVDHMGCDGILR